MRAFVCLPYTRAQIESALPRVRELVADARIIERNGSQWVTGTVPDGTTARELSDLLSLARIAPLDIRFASEAPRAGR